ncbi:biotin-dependent carboxyltransferase family protein [Shewanella psychropiezotolerans]|uniref:Biotin-dependent carboxyltransferase family protein n=1 Tax=Shewanella psychropiezotolerans TaxID=2593655 RepID=A0ABX5WS34_9GAMM|nr:MULTISPECIES: biotin-dependent carboxyltransferase family protein [Shewanella]MPY26386.1 biotin-dependent carboxyltransferase family protein [Shewanella sp. YLB-07]QDO81899.1 biotin-dependent carboxyltransferase family protein [Shewanella psychropiezotolerans]
MIEVLIPGFHTTVQDLGRTGYRHLGVSVSGALDRQALMLANRLVANPDNAAGLELTAGTLELKFHRDAWFSLTGANYEIKIGSREIWHGWRSKINAGETLILKGPKSGMRAYLAIDGGIDVPISLSSRSTLTAAELGGHQGRALKVGDRIPLGDKLSLSKPIGAVQRGYSNEVRALAGPEMALFTQDSRKVFWSRQWRLSNDSNRMGARLSGEALNLEQEPNLNSHAVMPGTIQVPPSGQPIVLLADGQTTGGYPKIATVIEADLWKLAQTRPGEKLQFIHVSPNQAEDANYEWQQYFYRLQKAIDSCS